MFNFFRRKCPNCKSPRTKGYKYCIQCGAPYRLSKQAATIERPPSACIYGPPPFPLDEQQFEGFDTMDLFGGGTTEEPFGCMGRSAADSETKNATQDGSADATDMNDDKSSRKSEVHDHL